MEHSYFWPDLNGDREYGDDDFAELFGGFVTHGVYDGDLSVNPGGGMAIIIPEGKAFVGPLWKVRKYYNDGPLTLPIANADGVLNRKDIIVLRSDANDRSITAKLIQGEFASNPIAPQITRDSEQYDIELAEISIPAGTTEITGALISDMRLDSSVCGIVTGVIQQVDTTTFYNQIADDLARFRSVNEADFMAWINGLKEVLDDETAGNLLNLINGLQDSKSDKSTIVTATLTAAGWTGSAAPYSQTVSAAGVTATSANELLPGASITADQLKALQAANIQDGSQAAGSITVKAYGDKPTINLPVRIIVRGDL